MKLVSVSIPRAWVGAEGYSERLQQLVFWLGLSDLLDMNSGFSDKIVVRNGRIIQAVAETIEDAVQVDRVDAELVGTHESISVYLSDYGRVDAKHAQIPGKYVLLSVHETIEGEGTAEDNETVYYVVLRWDPQGKFWRPPGENWHVSPQSGTAVATTGSMPALIFEAELTDGPNTQVTHPTLPEALAVLDPPRV